MFDIRSLSLDALNSATKYPSIPTYHTLDPGNGGLREETVAFKGEVIGTEKVDGTNSRVICLPGGQYVIGSREELLYARGDLIGNPALGIVAALRGLAERMPHTRAALDDGGKGHAEGIVLRAPDRSVIAKARFQDYRRTIKRRRATGNRRRG